MKKCMQCASCVVALVLLISGCASAPKTEPAKEPVAEAAPEPVAEPVAKPVDDALTALRDQMESLRADCLKYRLDVVVRDAWNAAEAVRTTGLDAYGKDYDLAKSSFEDAIARYTKIKDEGFALTLSELDASLAKAREEAIAAGANAYFPEQFGLADKSASDAASIRSSGDLAGSYDAGQLALLRYKILVEGMKAVALRQKIEKNDFSQYAPEELQSGDMKYAEAVASYGTADASSLDSMKTALESFRKVYNAGYRALAEKEIVRANEARSLCDSIKASRSMKKEYGAAMALYDQGAGAGVREDWERAYSSYSDAANALAAVYESAALKRNAADAAIAAAKSRQQASSELATKADLLAPLPANAEGYSEDPYVIESNSAEDAPAEAAPSSIDEPVSEEPAVSDDASPGSEVTPADTTAEEVAQ